MFSISLGNRPIVARSNNIANKPVSMPKMDTGMVADSVSFGSKKITDAQFPLRLVSGLPCPYCGEMMFTVNDATKFGLQMASAKGKELQMGLIQKLGPQVFTNQKSVAFDIIRHSKEKPELTIKEILHEMAPEAEIRLVEKQKRILFKAQDITKQLTPELMAKTDHDFEVVHSLIERPLDENGFRNKTLQSGFMNLFRKEKDPANKNVLATSIETLLTLPTSYFDKDAFIVKYSKRSSRETAEELLFPYRSSAEHLETRVSGGGTDLDNLLCVHRHCNSKRSSDELDVFAEKTPNLETHMTNHLFAVQGHLARNPNKQLTHYIPNIINRIDKQSHGVLNINLGGSK
ncbi:MAG: HNH endonuclease signature motif containing protein [Candidatus Gastranaerophilales bacterium]|nr:HNH endonuclease signature motif containing protein [Candidatus Gastranaerophilales bacterium]